MMPPFLKKVKGGFSVKLHRKLYSVSAVELADFSGVFSFKRLGACWLLTFATPDEAVILDVLGQLMYLSKGRKL